jgi:hypothetical protein
MKKVQKAVLFMKNELLPNAFSYILIAVIGFSFSACQKVALTTPEEEITVPESKRINTDAAFMNAYGSLSFTTAWELQQARAATAKYQVIENAMADGYMDIAVDVQNMGHHYLNPKLLDEKFDFRHPEILVYNRDDKGKQQLVAVEYAIPLSNPMPDGFSGAEDVWDGNEGFGLWLLHAWVWYKNPEGVFQPFNPLIDLH